MKENLIMLKKYLEFTKPNKKHFIVSFLGALLYRICVVLEPVFAAKVITSLTVKNFTWAIIHLLFVLLLYLLRNIFMHIKYMTHDKLLGDSYMRFQKMISDKIFIAEKANFKNNSKERLLNIFHTDSWNTANFADILTTRLAQLVQVIIIVVTIACTNVLVGLIIFLMIFVNAYIISFLQTRYARGTKRLRESIDNGYKEFSRLIDSKDFAQEDKIKNKLQKNFLSACDNNIKVFRERQVWSSAINNWFYVFCKVLITIFTIVMVVLVGKDSLTLEMYLIIAPYITTVFDSSNEVLTVFTDLKNATVNMNRIKVISNFTERDIVRFGNNKTDDVLGSIDFIDLYYKGKVGGETSLKDINFHIQQNETTLIYGDRGSGKRTIFELLIRDIPQTKGEIYIDGLNAGDYSKNAYYKNVAYTSSKPHFYGYSVLQELKMVNGNKEKMEKACKMAGIFDIIQNEKKGFSTPVEELNAKEKFLLGLARAILTGANIIAIYELPSNVKENEYKEILAVLEGLHGQKTIVVFSAVYDSVSLCDKVIHIESGEVKNIQFNDRNKEVENV